MAKPLVVGVVISLSMQLTCDYPGVVPGAVPLRGACSRATRLLPAIETRNGPRPAPGPVEIADTVAFTSLYEP